MISNTNQKPNLLDSRKNMVKFDRSNMLGSLDALDQQITHAWEDASSIQVDYRRSDIDNVVIAGMGGSGLGGSVIKSLFKEELPVPINCVNDYDLPAYVGPKSLVLLSSYSGTTEEVLVCAQQAKERKAQIMVITTGNTLLKFAQDNHYPTYIIDPKHNPSQQPRMAIGYAIFGTITLLAKTGLLNLDSRQVQAIAKSVKKFIKDCAAEAKQENNPAKTLAYDMIDQRPVVVVAEFLAGAAHVAANQNNENAKTFMDYKVVPEINHHLMEGLQFPASNKSTHIFLCLESVLYRPENSLRMKLTQEIIEQNEIPTLSIPLKSQTKIEQVFEMITLFGFAGFYLSMLEGIDPSPIPFVDQFKKTLQSHREGGA